MLLAALFALISVKAEAQLQVNPTLLESNNPSNVGWLYYGPQESDGTIRISAILFSYDETPQTATIKAVRRQFDTVFVGNFEDGLAGEGAPVQVYYPTIPQAMWGEVQSGSPDRVFEAVVVLSTPGEHIVEIEYEGPLHWTRIRFEFPLWIL